MQYTEYIFQLDGEAFALDLFEQTLADLGFESFVTNSSKVENLPEQAEACVQSLSAFVPTHLLNEQHLQQLIRDFPYAKVTILSHDLCPDKDWNTEWEKHYYQPIIIDNELVIHSTFHHNVPQCKYDIVINPKMAFGTGHHQTTSLILQELLRIHLQGLTVLDMGCGTGILAMLAALRGASHITAIDIDDWCVSNAQENIALNNIQSIDVLLGDANLLTDKHFDLILANINRNILLHDMHAYAQALRPNGTILMSGFYQEDIPVLVAQAQSLGLTLHHATQKDNWAMLSFHK